VGLLRTLTVSIFIDILDKVPLAGAFSDVLLEEGGTNSLIIYRLCTNNTVSGNFCSRERGHTYSTGGGS
jgi:hypothetical protein